MMSPETSQTILFIDAVAALILMVVLVYLGKRSDKKDSEEPNGKRKD